jgi:hypothetical protein
MGHRIEAAIEALAEGPSLPLGWKTDAAALREWRHRISRRPLRLDGVIDLRQEGHHGTVSETTPMVLAEAPRPGPGTVIQPGEGTISAALICATGTDPGSGPNNC